MKLLESPLLKKRKETKAQNFPRPMKSFQDLHLWLHPVTWLELKTIGIRCTCVLSVGAGKAVETQPALFFVFLSQSVFYIRTVLKWWYFPINFDYVTVRGF